MSPFATHNGYLNYTFPRRGDSPWLRDLSVRLSVTNVFDIEPPLADEDFGYRRGAGTSARGRAFALQVTKRL